MSTIGVAKLNGLFWGVMAIHSFTWSQPFDMKFLFSHHVWHVHGSYHWHGCLLDLSPHRKSHFDTKYLTFAEIDKYLNIDMTSRCYGGYKWPKLKVFIIISLWENIQSFPTSGNIKKLIDYTILAKPKYRLMFNMIIFHWK